MAFPLFILLNLVLFVRPEELAPELAGVRLYLIVMGLNLAVNMPRVVAAVTPGELARRPVVCCVVGLLAAVFASHLARGRLDAGLTDAGEFLKVVGYFLILLAVIDTPDRLRAFLGWCVPLVAFQAAAGLAQFYEYIDVEMLRPVAQWKFDPETGEAEIVYRIVGSGIFNDPNDLCLVLVFGSLCCVYRAATAAGRPAAALWLAPIGLFAYAMAMTQSRGGMLGGFAAVGGYVAARRGLSRGIPAAAVVGACVLFGLGGRLGSFSLSAGDTAHERVMLWAQGLTALFRQPLYLPVGLGPNEFSQECGLVAHNSFVQGYVELGLVGGGLFLGLFYQVAVGGLVFLKYFTQFAG